MRLESQILVYGHVALMLYIIYFFRDLLLMMVNPLNAEVDLVLDKEINRNIPSEALVIPKWIHQTYKTEEVPEHWVQSQKHCIDLHYPDYNYTLWTDAMVNDFLAEKYPWFLDTFRAYEHNIQRADSLRYFILREYGGIYLDLDDGCERRLDPLLQYPAFFRKTSPLGVSNDVMGTIPQHPLFIEMTENLERFSKINIFDTPYLSIMFSTGPMFVSVVYQRWIRKAWSYGLGLNKDKLAILNKFRPKVMQPYQYKNSIGSFFKIAEGSSWHTGDSNFMFVLGAHITACVAAGFILFFLVFFIELLLYVLLQNILNGFKGNTDVSSHELSNSNSEGESFSAAGETKASLFRIPFQLRVTRFINKLKGSVTGNYAPVSDGQMPNHGQTSISLEGNIASSNKSNNTTKHNYQRHQMRRQSNLPLEIQTHLSPSQDQQPKSHIRTPSGIV